MKMVGVSRGGGTRVKTQQLPGGDNCTVAVFITGFTASAGYNLHVYVRERGGAAFTGVRGRPSGPDAGFAAHVRTASTRDYSAAESVDLCAVRVSIHLYVGNPTA